ncbi:MAG: L,D-transpeptidase family protein, partial [Ensifer adhaerens]
MKIRVAMVTTAWLLAGCFSALAGDLADRVVVHKEKRILQLYRSGEMLRQYAIALGGNPIGHKQREGDRRTPEGLYVLDWRNDKSGYHLSIHVSYPAPADVQAAAAKGVDPGGMIMIHGQPNYFGWLAF